MNTSPPGQVYESIVGNCARHCVCGGVVTDASGELWVPGRRDCASLRALATLSASAIAARASMLFCLTLCLFALASPDSLLLVASPIFPFPTGVAELRAQC